MAAQRPRATGSSRTVSPAGAASSGPPGRAPVLGCPTEPREGRGRDARARGDRGRGRRGAAERGDLEHGVGRHGGGPGGPGPAHRAAVDPSGRPAPAPLARRGSLGAAGRRLPRVGPRPPGPRRRPLPRVRGRGRRPPGRAARPGGTAAGRRPLAGPRTARPVPRPHRMAPGRAGAGPGPRSVPGRGGTAGPHPVPLPPPYAAPCRAGRRRPVPTGGRRGPRVLRDLRRGARPVTQAGPAASRGGGADPLVAAAPLARPAHRLRRPGGRPGAPRPRPGRRTGAR